MLKTVTFDFEDYGRFVLCGLVGCLSLKCCHIRYVHCHNVLLTLELVCNDVCALRGGCVMVFVQLASGSVCASVIT